MSSEVAELERDVEALPDGWRLSTIGETADILDKLRVPLNSDERRQRQGPYPYWGANGIVDHIDGYIFDEPLVLMAEDGGYFDEAATRPICHRLDGRAWVNNHAHIIRPTGADRDYFYYWFVHRDITPFIKGGTRSKLNQADLKRLPIWLPPLDQQRRIAEVLRSVDEAIAANEAVAVQARRTYQAALTELVGSGLDHWETVCLGQIATFVNGRGFKPHEWCDEGYPIIRIQNLNGGTDFNYYSGDFNPKILVRPGNLLFAWSGSRGTSFGPHIWRGPEGVLNYHTWKVVPAAPEDRDYLYFALRHLTKKIEDEAHGASALVHMQKAYVVDYEIQLPPPEERNAIAATLIDLQEAANNADQVYREARAMKGHLMSDLLSGRVRVPA